MAANGDAADRGFRFAKGIGGKARECGFESLRLRRQQRGQQQSAGGDEHDKTIVDDSHSVGPPAAAKCEAAIVPPPRVHRIVILTVARYAPPHLLVLVL